jgi:dihydrodipicolinate synthase/N-acetylneuraminate lyase
MQNDNRLLHGVSVACLTPMDGSGEAIDYDTIGPYVDFLCERSVNGLFVVGTTGEGCILSSSERKKIVEAFIAAARRRVLVVPQCGSLVYEETLDFVRHAATCGADGAAILTPFYFNYSQDSLYEYYASILEFERELPIYAYNIPFMTNNAIDVPAMKKLAAKYHNFCGVKDSSGNATKILECVRQMPESFAVIAGSDPLFLPLMLCGIKGCVSGPGSVIPEPYVKVYELLQAGKLDEARAAQKALTALSNTLEGGGNLDLLKKALAWRGISAGTVRSPMARVPADQEKAKRIDFDALWRKEGYRL